jgi:hypothetical protein
MSLESELTEQSDQKPSWQRESSLSQDSWISLPKDNVFVVQSEMSNFKAKRFAFPLMIRKPRKTNVVNSDKVKVIESSLKNWLSVVAHMSPYCPSFRFIYIAPGNWAQSLSIKHEDSISKEYLPLWNDWLFLADLSVLWKTIFQANQPRLEKSNSGSDFWVTIWSPLFHSNRHRVTGLSIRCFHLYSRHCFDVKAIWNSKGAQPRILL